MGADPESRPAAGGPLDLGRFQGFAAERAGGRHSLRDHLVQFDTRWRGVTVDDLLAAVGVHLTHPMGACPLAGRLQHQLTAGGPDARTRHRSPPLHSTTSP